VAAYAGTTIGSVMLPAHGPGLGDLLLPLLLALAEFLLFAVLAYQITALPRSSVLAAWWFAMVAFGVAVYGSVRRARQLIRRGSYSDDALGVKDRYLASMRNDLVGTTAILVTAVLGFSFQLCYGRLHTGWLRRFDPDEVNLVLAVPPLLLVILANVGHQATARVLRADLAPPAESAAIRAVALPATTPAPHQQIGPANAGSPAEPPSPAPSGETGMDR
jgi:hypothetical protein